MSTKMMARLEARTKAAETRIKQNRELNEELKDPDSESLNSGVMRKPHNGLTSEQIVSKTERQVYRNEQLGFFDAIPIAKRDVVPTLLTRLPVFMPITKAKQKTLLNDDNAFEFTTPFGSGKRYGANLTVFDEDVLYALARVAGKKLIGPHDNLPIKVPKTYKGNEQGNVNVDTVVCTITQILDVLKCSKGGKMRRDVLASLERLASTTIVLTINKEDRYLGKCEIGKPIKLIDIEWKRYSTDSVIYAQFSPIVTYWLESEFTYYDWSTRRRLKKALSKALHRYLSSQPKDFYKLNKLTDIADSIGAHIRQCDLKRCFESAVKELIAVGFLIDYEIKGTGRASPLRLYATRK